MNRLKTWALAVLSQWRLLTSAVIAAAIIHILVTLSAAEIGESSSYKALTSELPVNQVAFSGPITAKTQPLPFYNADALYAYCRYDASTSRIRVSAKLPDVGWSLSLHTPKGENFYFVPGNTRRVIDINLVLEPPGNVFAHGTTEVSKSKASIPVIKLPGVRGLVILKAPIKGLAYRRMVDEQRAEFRCAPQNALARLQK
ncbi:MAG: hypothetical protein ACR2PI_00920 [Hyphomicrobiaceae bacterium]